MVKDMAVALIPGLSCAERLAVLEKFEREEKFPFPKKRDLEDFLKRSLRGNFRTMDEIFSRAERHEKTVRIRGIRRLRCGQAGYPPLLGEIYDPPFLLYYLGRLPDPEKPAAALVGTRKPSPAGSAQAYSLGRELAGAGIAVVSGLALGIDAMAHRGCVDGGGLTVAVLGSGLDELYPSSNRPLARRILESEGALVSEYPPGTKPYRWNFPERNRIISGMARGTVIVEAPERSGALHTARFALEQGRDLWAGKAGLGSPRGAGTRRLVEEGCGKLGSAADILAEWNISGSEEKWQ
ncbi:MAG: DNA-processing protein DprA [Treponema sp.]|jgi:DNA processing protein|nr:DNA-processing protein DprA [Treponema sp.]